MAPVVLDGRVQNSLSTSSARSRPGRAQPNRKCMQGVCLRDVRAYIPPVAAMPEGRAPQIHASQDD